MMIKDKKLLLFPVNSWEDVYENWLVKSIKRELTTEKRRSLPIALGQCWTIEEESDAMWRIYSKIEKQLDGKEDNYDDMAIRVKTTPRELLEQILASNESYEKVFIGPVKYLERNEFEEKRKTIQKLFKNNPEKALANSFFIKRNPFEHEKEVRIIVISKTRCKSVAYDITPNCLIDEFVIDPRIQRKDFYIICKILGELGVSDKKIRQSELYQWDPFPIIKNPKKPKTKEELKEIIIMRMIRNGNNCNLNDLCLSRVTDLSDLFADRLLCRFNGDISGWDVSNVKNMSGMFDGSQFNGDISNWDVSSVEDMSGMFTKSMFNKNISKWNVRNVKNMSGMFDGSQFNGDISKWDVGNVKNMSGMFDGSQFNGDISKWDVGNVEDMSWMFYDSSFHGNIDDWNVNKVQDIQGLFNDDSSNEDLIVWKKLHYCPCGNKGKDGDEKELDEIEDPSYDQYLWEQNFIKDSFSPENAYQEGYVYGRKQGFQDGEKRKSFESGYDDSSSYIDNYEEKYQEGYRDGYKLGYDEGVLLRVKE
jgi:surface protein